MSPKKSPENLQLSNIFEDLIFDLTAKDIVLPTNAQDIIAEDIKIMKILQKTRRVRKHPNFANLAIKGKTHEDFLVGWAKLEAFCDKLEGERKVITEEEWEAENQEILDILEDIGEATAA